MRRDHAHWPMFCCDLQYAQSWLTKQNSLLNNETEQLLHNAITLGLKKEVLELLDSHPLELSKKIQRAIRFRVCRSEGGDYYPWLFEPLQLKEIVDKWKSMKQNKKDTVKILLHGGVGDHLQDLGLLIPLFKNTNMPLEVYMSEQRKIQFESLLKGIIPISDKGLNKKDGLHIMELMAALGPSPPSYQSWIKISQEKNNKIKRILTCWKAVGKGDRLSYWSRSVRFNEVIKFYKILISNGVEANTITDISNWEPWEANVLKRAGVNQYKPSNGDILGLASLVAKSEHVISIDTALVHLCVSMNKKNNLLLPYFFDERWQDLLKKGSSYQQNCLISKQIEFGKWEKNLNQLISNLI